MSAVAKAFPPDSPERVASALSSLDASDRELWVKMSFAVKDGLGEDGKEIWKDWSRSAENFDEAAADATWKSAKAGGRVKVATLFHLARDAGWRDDSKPVQIDPAELKRREEERQRREAEAKAEDEKKRAAAAANAKEIWIGGSPDVHGHPYERKKTQEGKRELNFGKNVRRGQWAQNGWDDALLVPIYGPDSKISSIEAINVDGKKMTLKDSAKSGGIYPLAPFSTHESGVVIVAEGLATAAACMQATGYPAVAAFCDTNLRKAAEFVKSKRQDVRVVVAADIGSEDKARAAAAAVGGVVAVPAGIPAIKRGTDFWDIWAAEQGDVLVKHIINTALKAGPIAIEEDPAEELEPAPADAREHFTQLLAEDASAEQTQEVARQVVHGETGQGFDDLMAAISKAGTKDELVALADTIKAQRMRVADIAVLSGEFMNAFKHVTGATLTKSEARAMLAPKKGGAREAVPVGRGAAEVVESPIEGHFRVLGFDRKTMFIYSFEKKQVLEYSARDLTESGLLELAPASWWEASFPGSGGIDRKTAANAIIRLAGERGIYNQGLVRGRGAWWDGERLVLHLGDRLLVDGTETGLAEIASSRYVYEQDSPLADIVSEALTDDEGRRINEISRMFRWERSVSADMLAGWLFLAPICGALKWRPHIWITGGAGSGKTTVLEHFVRRLLPESMPIFSNGDSSEAGLRQELASEARPLLVDETEADSDRAKSRIESVLGLLRQSSSDTTSKTYRGTVGGKSQSFSLRTMACMASIGVALRQQQDFERIEVLALRPKRSDQPETNWETIKDQLKWIAKDHNIGSRMLRRAINMADVIVATVDVFAAAAAVVLGTQRNGDQIGTLLAGAWCLQKSRAPSFDEAEAVLESICWDEFRASHQEEGVDLIATMLGCPVILEGGVRTTIGLLIERAAGRDAEGLESMEPRRANTGLSLYGLKVVADDLRVHTKNAELERLLSGTRFRNGLHERMRRIEGANTMSGRAFRIGGVSTNGLVIPLSSVLPETADEAAAASSPSAHFSQHVPDEPPV